MDILNALGFASDEVEAVEDRVGDVAHLGVGEEFEGVGPRRGEGEGVAECQDSYLLLMVSYKFTNPPQRTSH